MSTKPSTTNINPTAAAPTTYHEVKIGKTLYRVTSVFKGEVKLKDALEDFAVRRALREVTSENNPTFPLSAN